MSLDQNKIAEDLAQALRAIEAASDLDGLKQVKIDYVGDKSALAKANQALATVDQSLRAQFGKLVGSARAEVNQAFEQKSAKLSELRDAQMLLTEKVDVTLPARRTLKGGLHPLTILTNEINDLFIGLGYKVAEGPELEAEWLNFDALNIPADHPARTMQDTFFVEPLESKLVLRTHTSPVQIRTMLNEKPPIYVICPGKTYRADELDATHTPVFHQVEGLVIDEKITMGDLKGTLDFFAKSIFGSQVKTRLRPSFFPFTEPSAEVDIRYSNVGGQLRIGEGDKWMEILGSGMVHPKVLAAAGVNPDEWQGFAFGMGIDRIAMLKYGIPDLRAFFESDLRWLRHYGFAALDMPNLPGGLSR